MRKITTNGIETLSNEESGRIRDLLLNTNNHDDYHYLAFDRQLNGFSPLGTYLLNYPELKADSDKTMETLLKQQEVGTNPVAKLTLYPVTKIDGAQYSLDLDNIEKHFAEILKINDTLYRTKYLFVDFGHGADNFDESLIIQKLSELLSKSNMLEAIYIEDNDW